MVLWSWRCCCDCPLSIAVEFVVGEKGIFAGSTYVLLLQGKSSSGYSRPFTTLVNTGLFSQRNCTFLRLTWHRAIRASVKYRGCPTAVTMQRLSLTALNRVGAAVRPNMLSTYRSYHDKVIDHYENPRNVGSMNKDDKNVGTGLVGAPACGDVMKLQIRVNNDGEIVETAFKTFGCGSAIASSSLATEWVKGMNVDEASKIRNSDIAKELRLPPVKLHCSMLAEDAIKAAILDLKTKRGSSAP